MPKFEVITQLSVTMMIEAETQEQAIERGEHFAGNWMEPTYEQLQDYEEDHAPIDQVVDWDAVISTVEEVEG